MAVRELGVPMWQGLVMLPFGYKFDWEVELAGNFTFAFARALEELLLNSFPGVPVTSVEGGISIDTSVVNDDLPKGGDDSVKDEEGGMHCNKLLNEMIDKELIQKYQSFDPNELQLKLTLRPIDWKLSGLFTIPMLTRDIVKKKGHLEGAYSRIEATFQETGSVAEVQEMTKKLAEDVGFWSRRTVIAEASIQCMQFFQVVDKRTGVVVQGMEDGMAEEEVCHLVRFEVVTDRSSEDGAEKNSREVGSWKIIDWNDMLQGNVFH